MRTLSNNNKNFFITLALCLPVTIACIDLMALNVATHDIMQSFSTTVDLIQWLLSGYTIGTASFLITVGRVADVYGRKKTLLYGLFIFGLASFVAACATSINILIISRFAQGVASGIMMTTVLSIITHQFSAHERGAIIAKWAFSLGLGLAAGPFIGGIFIYFWGWRTIFAINIPICILSFYLVSQLLPESKDQNSYVKIDWLETLLFCVLMILFVLVLSDAKLMDFQSMVGIIQKIILVFSIFLFSFLERQKLNPLIDTSLFSLDNFLAASTCGFMSYFCMYGWLFIFGIYLQKSLMMSPIKAALILSSFSIAFAFSAKVLSNYIKTLENRQLMQWGFILCGGVFIGLTGITLLTDQWVLILLFFLLGIGIMLINAPSMSAATQAVPPHKTGIASGTILTIRWVGGSLGIASVSMVYQYGIHACCILLALAAGLGLMFTKKIKIQVNYTAK